MNNVERKAISGVILLAVSICLAAWGGDDTALPIDAWLLLTAVAFAGYALLISALGPAATRADRGADKPICSRFARNLLLIVLVLRAVVLLAPQRGNSDVARYLWDGHLVTHGYSPWHHAPNDEALDPVFDAQLYGELHPEYNAIPSVYGPVAMLVFGLARAIPGDGFVTLRLVMMTCDVVTVFLLVQLLTSLERSPVWVMLYAANPLLLDSFAQRGQMDALMLPLMVWGVLLISKERWGLAGVAAGLVCGVKVTGLFLLPVWCVWVWRSAQREPRARFAWGLAGALVIALGPMLAMGLDGGSGILVFANRWNANASCGALLQALFGKLNGRIISLAFCIAGICVVAWRSRSGEIGSLNTSLLGAILCLLCFAPAVFPWYVTWALPFLPVAAALGHRLTAHVTLVFSAVVLLWYCRFLVPPHETTSAFPQIAKQLTNASEVLVEPWRVVEYGVLAMTAAGVLRGATGANNTGNSVS